ncbi:MAG TPA: cation transporter [Bacteroidetes bacterium]|nr:cation transporter [Bacteroidota bacterium]
MSQSKVLTAIKISFAVSFLSFAIKFAGFLITGSNTVLSDLAESIVHVLAVGFSVYGVYLSSRPADEKHPYGHERIEFLSVGVEGSVIIMAGFMIIYQSIKHLILGLEPENLEEGILVVAAAGTVNLILGTYLTYVGKKEKNNILKGNGKHTLTDVYTSAGVVVTLILIKYTNFTILDSLVALIVAAYIMYEGFRLVRFAFRGIMDIVDESQDKLIKEVLQNNLPGGIESWHGLRHRTAGRTTWIELHALFDKDIRLEEAHDIATELEKRLINAIDGDAIITIHLEPEENHNEVHDPLKGANENLKLDQFI